jgi:hypothetical protein
MTEIQRARAEAAHFLDLAFSISDVTMKTALQALAAAATGRAAELEAYALSGTDVAGLSNFGHTTRLPPPERQAGAPG